MSSKKIISLSNVTKIYKLYDEPIDRLKEALHPFRKKYHREFYAVNNVSFHVNKNEIVGLIGKNGSGKSTILKMITGILNPSDGAIQVEGKVSALLELGAGFNPDYTGMENIYLHGAIMGFTKEEIDLKVSEILSFADIGEFINQPVKMYSSGMFVRLAFAVAINVNPDILIIDEALSVGDVKFQQKCFRKIEEFKRDKTILVVSHDMGVITKYCDRAIWINEGTLLHDGSPVEISKKYQAFMIDSTLTKYDTTSEPSVNSAHADNTIDPIDSNLDVLGDQKVEILGIAMFDQENGKTLIVYPGQIVKIVLKVKSHTHIQAPIVGFTIKDRLGTILAQCNSFVQDKMLLDLAENQVSMFTFTFHIPQLNQGRYSISPAIASGTQDEHVQHCWVHDALVFQVLNKQKYHLEGILVLDEVDINQIS
ncbi:ABC transporter ATP-binding protein [Paenibacillus contaminans]|uniref:ABC transporter ATP-binding protein n=1 Tax=Paenibacillus contaminans TaxID=450362 RepID=A0A329M1K1_9BACL|nr:ABC transporter ATP-binding protein [Paenibacillus contaminans]RAV13794.1 ABC transporter ATP-binding protein [Paenibacillus contaminans]